jgi:hypothetical protein
VRIKDLLPDAVAIQPFLPAIKPISHVVEEKSLAVKEF